jgi:pyruvate carboxylase
MSKAFITPFMLNLLQQLTDEKKVSESSANKYLQLLTILNDKKPFTSLSFTKNIENIDSKLEKYAPSTQTTFYSTLVSVLSFYKDKPTYKKTYNYYYDKMMNSKPKGDTAVKSEAQEKNWEDWSEIQKTKEELVKKVEEFYDRKQFYEIKS